MRQAGHQATAAGGGEPPDAQAQPQHGEQHAGAGEQQAQGQHSTDASQIGAQPGIEQQQGQADHVQGLHLAMGDVVESVVEHVRRQAQQ